MGRRWSSQPHFRSVQDPPETSHQAPTKFLGQLQTSSQKSNTCESGKKFIAVFHHKLETLDEVQVRGEYKLLIYKCYLVPSFHFVLAVDPIAETAIKKMQAAALRMIKRWLNFPRCFTTSALRHPNVIDIPSLSDLKTNFPYIHFHISGSCHRGNPVDPHRWRVLQEPEDQTV